MTNLTDVDSLRTLIHTSLDGLIGEKCVLYDVPYYKNIGDVLIFEGELQYLKSIGCEILDIASYHTCTFPSLEQSVTILFNGGGNFGDLYKEHIDFMLEIVKHYPENRIVIFPQSIYFKNLNSMHETLKVLASHQDCIFCARDKNGYGQIKPYFKERAICIPDMAFCIDMSLFDIIPSQTTEKNLYIRRKDCEKLNSIYDINEKYVSDWPTFEYKICKSVGINTLYDRLWKVEFLRDYLRDRWNRYAINVFRPKMIKIGLDFIKPYKKIVTERLHGAILSILMGKDVGIVDNSYGKNKNFYDSWLKDFSNVRFIPVGEK